MDETLKERNRRILRESYEQHLERMENDYEYRSHIEAERKRRKPILDALTRESQELGAYD